MKIPRRFKLYGYTFKVLRKSLKQLGARAEAPQGRVVFGLFDRDSNEIWVCKSPEVPQEVCEQTFWHELMHAVFHVSAKPRLGDDETLVDQLGHLLHQFASSSI